MLDTNLVTRLEYSQFQGPGRRGHHPAPGQAQAARGRQGEAQDEDAVIELLSAAAEHAEDDECSELCPDVTILLA